jgi:hypothetical protein
MNWIERAPLLLVAAAFLTALLLIHEIALWLGRGLAARTGGAEARGYVVSSALALLGLLFAFTFNAAQERFQARRDLVVAEANALGTTYLRFQLLDPPWRDTLSADLLRYAEMRLRGDQVGAPAEAARYAQEVSSAQGLIWEALRAALRQTRPDPGLTLGLLQTVNETFDLAASRRAAREGRVPVMILRTLIVSSVMAAGILGYTEAGGRRATLVLFGLLLLLTLAFGLILDLDRPFSGSVRVSQAPLERAVADIRQGEAAKAAAAKAR